MTAPARNLLLGGIGALGLGQAAVTGAFLAPALFTPGVWLVGLGIAASAGAGVLALARPAPIEPPRA